VLGVEVEDGLDCRELRLQRFPGLGQPGGLLARIPFLRFSYEQIVNRSGYVVRTLGAALGST